MGDKRKWFGRHGLKVAVGVCVIVAAVAAVILRPRGPEHAFQQVQKISSEADVEKYGRYLTPKGRDVVLWLLSKRDDAPMEPDAGQAVIGKPVVSGNCCDITCTLDGGDTVVAFRFLKDRRWQFDDIYLKTSGGKQIDLWCSYLKDHPVKAYLKMNWQELVAAFLAGFMHGMGGY